MTRNLFLFFGLLLASNVWSKSIVIDVRTLDEWNQGHLYLAKRIEWQEIDIRISELTLDKGQEIILYCQSGNRSGKALKQLNELGFFNVINAGGLFQAQELTEDRIVSSDD